MRAALGLAGVLLAVAAGGCAAGPAGAGAGTAVTAPAPAAGGPAVDALAARFQTAFGQGYERRDAAVVLGLYAADAKVQTRLYGEVDLGGFRQVLERDFARLQDGVKSEIELQQFTVTDGVGTAAVRFVITGATTEGLPVRRQETWHFRMRDGDGGWKIFQQSYRPDFSGPAGTAPHPDVPTDKLQPLKYHGRP